jgi:hypothetical protein
MMLRRSRVPACADVQRRTRDARSTRGLKEGSGRGTETGHRAGRRRLLYAVLAALPEQWQFLKRVVIDDGLMGRWRECQWRGGLKRTFRHEERTILSVDYERAPQDSRLVPVAEVDGKQPVGLRGLRGLGGGDGGYICWDKAVRRAAATSRTRGEQWGWDMMLMMGAARLKGDLTAIVE